MTTSISSKALLPFVADRQTDGQNICRVDAHIREECAHKKMRALSYIGAEKITFPTKPARQTDIHTDRRTDISVYRVASLLKRNDLNIIYNHARFMQRYLCVCVYSWP